jgi:hypothetical protein
MNDFGLRHDAAACRLGISASIGGKTTDDPEGGTF